MTHSHLAPQFGCKDCIERERNGWAQAKYDAWLKKYKFPKCASCGHPTTNFGWEFDGGKLVAGIMCSTDNDACLDEDFYEEIT